MTNSWTVLFCTLCSLCFRTFPLLICFPPPTSELSLSISLLGLNLEEHCDWLADGREYPSQREPDNFHIYFRGADTSESNPECHSGWCAPRWLAERKKKKSCFIETSWTAASDASLILKRIVGVKGSVGQIPWGSLSRSLLTSSCLQTLTKMGLMRGLNTAKLKDEYLTVKKTTCHFLI